MKLKALAFSAMLAVTGAAQAQTEIMWWHAM